MWNMLERLQVTTFLQALALHLLQMLSLVIPLQPYGHQSGLYVLSLHMLNYTNIIIYRFVHHHSVNNTFQMYWTVFTRKTCSCDVGTRWSSTLLMVERALILHLVSISSHLFSVPVAYWFDLKAIKQFSKKYKTDFHRLCKFTLANGWMGHTQIISKDTWGK